MPNGASAKGQEFPSHVLVLSERSWRGEEEKIMKDRLLTGFLFAVVFLDLGSTALATSTWYVNGVSGSNSNGCTSATTPSMMAWLPNERQL